MSAHTHTAPAKNGVAQEHLLHDEEHGGPKLYAAILGALLFLTFITVAASRLDVGSNMVNVVIAMGIATLKASLVALFFMHLRWDKAINQVIFCSSLFFLGLFLITCYTDVQSRFPSEPTNIKAPTNPAVTTPGVAPIPGHGPEGAASPSGGGPAIPGASQEGSHGGAAIGTHNPPVAPPSSK